jgi:hypothetical protein
MRKFRTYGLMFAIHIKRYPSALVGMGLTSVWNTGLAPSVGDGAYRKCLRLGEFYAETPRKFKIRLDPFPVQSHVEYQRTGDECQRIQHLRCICRSKKRASRDDRGSAA